MLPDIFDYFKFVLCGKAETGSAGEQPVRNNRTNWNEYEFGFFSTSLKIFILVIYAFKNSIFLCICPFFAGAVHKLPIALEAFYVSLFLRIPTKNKNI